MSFEWIEYKINDQQQKETINNNKINIKIVQLNF